LDQQGNLKPEAFNQLMQISPAVGMEVRGNQLVNQERQARSAFTQSKVADAQRQEGYEMSKQALSVYEQSIANGMSPEQAQAVAQRDVYSPWYDRVSKSGIVSPDVMRQVPPNFDPMRARSGVQAYEAAQAQPLTPLQKREE